ncbi:hypothetical protein Hanom_Chr05g00419011 [Helianthus anomalus]
MSSEGANLKILPNLCIPSQFRSSSNPLPLNNKGFHCSNKCRCQPPLHMPKPSQSPLHLTRYTSHP